jgi:hypothetical protein
MQSDQTSEAESILDGARRRGDVIRSELVRSRWIIPLADLSVALQMSAETLNGALQAGRLFTVEHDGHAYFPSFLSDPGLKLSQVERVVRVLGDDERLGEVAILHEREGFTLG